MCYLLGGSVIGATAAAASASASMGLVAPGSVELAGAAGPVAGPAAGSAAEAAAVSQMRRGKILFFYYAIRLTKNTSYLCERKRISVGYAFQC